MRLFWKVFLLLLITLMITAALSGWLSQRWMHQNQAFETRLSALTELGETAISLYQDEGIETYHQWLQHTMRNHRFRAALVHADGQHLLRRHVPPPLQPLLNEVLEKQQKLTVIDPPRLLAALPISRNGQSYFWLVHTHISKQEMRQGSKSMLIIRLISALLAIAFISWFLTRMFTGPIRQLQSHAELLGKGKLDSKTPDLLSNRKDELGDLACSFDQMAVELNKLINSHKQLIRDISHELRSPLARLQVALELARNKAGEIAAYELDHIEKESEELNSLIGEVITLSRFEHEAINASHETIELEELIQAIVSDAAFEIEASHKSILFADHCSCQINGDRLWIGRALDNVIRNAIRHTAEKSAVEVSLKNTNGHVLISVRDFGVGVSETDLPRLFEPFFRVSEARERFSKANRTGYGLGLAIARHAIELHQGNMSAENHPDGGLVISIMLPMMIV